MFCSTEIVSHRLKKKKQPNTWLWATVLPFPDHRRVFRLPTCTDDMNQSIQTLMWIRIMITDDLFSQLTHELCRRHENSLRGKTVIGELMQTLFFQDARKACADATLSQVSCTFLSWSPLSTCSYWCFFFFNFFYFVLLGLVLSKMLLSANLREVWVHKEKEC